MHNSTPELITQEVFLDTFGTAFVDHASDCLGADDGAGVFLMLEMIDANVEGTYIFHRGEERGGWGSSQIAELHADYIKQFTIKHDNLLQYTLKLHFYNNKTITINNYNIKKI